MINHRHKKAFSMITAIFTIVIMASVTALIMNVTGKTVKETTVQYQKEQAVLLARSYTELGLLYAIHYDRGANNDCLETITAEFGDPDNLYEITINLKYLSNDTLLPQTCEDDGNTIARWVDNGGTGGFNQTISVVIDVYVKYKNFDDPTTNRKVTFHRRTLQKL